METLFVLLLCALAFWACWHWFLQQWLERVGLLGFVKAKIAAHQIPDEAYYEQASKEIRSGNLREGLWTKAWAEASGDNTKAQAIYIRLRVESMKAETSRRFNEWGADSANQSPAGPEKTIVACARCGTRLRMPVGKLLDICCTKCGHEFRVDTAHGNRIEEFKMIEDQIIGRIDRLTFLWLWLGTVIVTLVATIMVNEGGLAQPSLSPLNFATGLVAAITAFSFAIIIARLRDADKSGWWSLFALIPLVYLLVVFCLLALPGTPGRNRFGPRNIGFFVST